MRISRMTFALVLCVGILLAVAGPIANATTITYTFTATGTGSIGATNFGWDLVTVTAIGDTSSIFQFLPNVYVVVPTQFNVNISGVGTANFTAAGHLGGNGYVFSNEPSAVAGFGTTDDRSDTYNAAFGTYDLSSSIGPIPGVSMYFTGEPTTLGGLWLLTGTPGTFTASTVPEPGTLLLLGTGLLGAVGAIRCRINL